MDMPFFNPYASQDGGSSGGGGTTDYDALSNRPVINLTGNNTVITKLKTGVYNIKKSFKITEDDEERISNDDDLFYIHNDGATCQMIWVSASGITKVSVPITGTAADIGIDTFSTGGSIKWDLIGEF